MNIRLLPNILSVSRIGLSFLLLLLFKHPIGFTLFYLFVGLTDVLDGYLARKLKAESLLGARLDSIGDFVFYIVLIAYIWFCYANLIMEYMIPIVFIFIVRISNIFIGLFKFGKLIMFHTIANKVAGLMVFVIPILLLFNVDIYVLLTLIVALIATVEEMAIVLQTTKESININQRFIFKK